MYVWKTASDINIPSDPEQRWECIHAHLLKTNLWLAAHSNLNKKPLCQTPSISFAPRPWISREHPHRLHADGLGLYTWRELHAITGRMALDWLSLCFPVESTRTPTSLMLASHAAQYNLNFHTVFGWTEGLGIFFFFSLYMISSEHAEQKLGGRICVWLSFKKSTVQHFDVLSFPGH